MASNDPQGPAAPQDPTESWAAAPTSELPAPAARPPAPGASPQPAVTQAAPEPAHPAYATVGAGPAGGPGGTQGTGGGGQGPGGYGSGGSGPGGYGPGGYGPGGYGPAGGPPGPPPGPPGARQGGGPGFWRRATSTTGGIVGLVVAGVLVVLLVLGVAGMAAFAVGRRVADHDGPRMSQLRDGRGNGVGPGQRGPKQRQRQVVPPQGGMGGMGGNGRGLGSVLGGAAALGNVEHGEFTVTGTDGKATVMTLQRGSVTAASSTSLSVKSADGFTATYTLDSSTRTPGRTAASGDSVLVLAQKQGSKAVLVRMTR